MMLLSPKVERMNKEHKAQSAMDYVMSYGWTIIVIMIVIASLFYLGVFSGKNIQPRAPQESARFTGQMDRSPLHR